MLISSAWIILLSGGSKLEQESQISVILLCLGFLSHGVSIIQSRITTVIAQFPHLLPSSQFAECVLIACTQNIKHIQLQIRLSTKTSKFPVYFGSTDTLLSVLCCYSALLYILSEKFTICVMLFENVAFNLLIQLICIISDTFLTYMSY